MNEFRVNRNDASIMNSVINSFVMNWIKYCCRVLMLSFQQHFRWIHVFKWCFFMFSSVKIRNFEPKTCKIFSKIYKFILKDAGITAAHPYNNIRHNRNTWFCVTVKYSWFFMMTLEWKLTILDLIWKSVILNFLRQGAVHQG